MSYSVTDRLYIARECIDAAIEAMRVSRYEETTSQISEAKWILEEAWECANRIARGVQAVREQA